MAEQFYTILTSTGKAKIANSVTLGTKVNLTTLKVGDSNGAYYNPSESQTDLVHSVYSCNVTSVAVDETNSNWINVICAIPSDVGDFYIREAGVFDDGGNLIAIGKYPETYKPIAADGSTKELYIKMTLEVTNTSSVELKIDPTVILATKSDITTLTNSISQINEQMSEKVNKTSIANNLTTTASGSVLDATQGKVLQDEINTITINNRTSGTLADGTFYDIFKIGQLQIINMFKSVTVAVSTTWGSLFVSDSIDLPAFPTAFSAIPTVTIASHPNGSDSWAYSNIMPTATDPGSVKLLRATSNASVACTIHVQAIGIKY